MDSLPKVFLCYARSDNRHEDPRHRWLDRVREALSPFEDQEEIEIFHDNDVPEGKEWDDLIVRQAGECQVAVLLVSLAFLKSKYIRTREMPILLRRWRAGEILLLPVMLSPCHHDEIWYRFPDAKAGPDKIRLGDIQHVGDFKDALVNLNQGQQDQRLSDTARVVIRHIRKSHEAKASAVASNAETANDEQWITAATRMIKVTASRLGIPAPGDKHLEDRRRATLATPDHPWINSLDMQFVAVPGTKALFSVWPTRVRDYRAFADDRGGLDDSWRDPLWQGVPVTPGPDHPVVNVSWQDAQEFCRWLTDREHRQGRLQPGLRYRLPTDREWSAAVGLPEEPGKTPKDRDGKIPGVFPWGTQWPPPRGAGNFADATCKKAFGNKPGVNWTFIEGYDDGFATTSPVGSFQRSSTGLYDLSGNVWEWCEDLHEGSGTSRALRGGSWDGVDPRYLLSSCRNGGMPDKHGDYVGFRVVLGVDEPAR